MPTRPSSPITADRGRRSVTDIYLPGWLSRRIPVVSGSVLALGLVLNLRAWLGRRPVD